MALTAWKRSHPEYKLVPASYAGRLDPMASGTMLVLLGDECKKQKKYTKLDKTYVIEVLLDLGSDTGDILGLITPSDKETIPQNSSLRAIFKKEIGAHEQAYPVYSSKTVAGKPLFLYALQGRLDTIDIPTHTETIYSIQLRKIYTISSESLSNRITSLLELVPLSTEPSKELGADFRKNEVSQSWKKVLATERTYTVLLIAVSCGSGTYMRSLAGRVGIALGTRALALSIHRTSVGDQNVFKKLLHFLRY